MDLILSKTFYGLYYFTDLVAESSACFEYSGSLSKQTVFV